jgi:hypothetical protein
MRTFLIIDIIDTAQSRSEQSAADLLSAEMVPGATDCAVYPYRAVTQTILANFDPSRVDACDQSALYVGHARRATSDPRALFSVADAAELP